MSQHLSRQIFEEYLNRTLGRDQLLAADLHLGECAGCREQFERLIDMDSLVISISEEIAVDPAYDEHLEYEQLEGYVDGSISEVSREIADVHIADCDLCRGQINDLRELKASIGQSAVGVSAAAPAGRVTLWEKITAGFAVRAALAAAALAALGFGLWALSVRLEPDVVETVVVSENAANESPNNSDVYIGSETGEIAQADEPANDQPTPIISLADGARRIEIDNEGKLSGIDAGRFEGRIIALLKGGDLKVTPAARELRSASGVLMGGGSPGAPFGLTSPVGKVIAIDRPQFNWRPLADAETYVVTVFDENFTKVAESPALKTTSWTSDARLKRGSIYNWQVTANKAGQEIKSPIRPAPDAKFKIVDAAAANDIEAARRTGSHLLLGTAYANAGLTAEAEREFQALVKQNPRSELAKRLLRKVQASK